MKSITRSDLNLRIDRAIIEYMDHLAKGGGIVHPDVEERMKELSMSAKNLSLRKYKSSIVIKENQTLSIVAVAFGTAYSVKTGKMNQDAIDSGAKTTHQWSTGDSLNLNETFGPDWVVGAWESDEETWILS